MYYDYGSRNSVCAFKISVWRLYIPGSGLVSIILHFYVLVALPEVVDIIAIRET